MHARDEQAAGMHPSTPEYLPPAEELSIRIALDRAMTGSALTESLRETLACFDGTGEPRTATEVADPLDLGRRSTYERLERLVEHGRIKTKKVGASARVWWRPPPAADRSPSGGEPPPSAELPVDDVLDDAEIGLFVIDANLEVAQLNKTAERYFGLKRERVLGQNKRDLVTEQLAPAVADGTSFSNTVLATHEDNISNSSSVASRRARTDRRVGLSTRVNRSSPARTPAGVSNSTMT